ncbi:MAG: tRNA (adenosine(37)-N6)-dimethylallyltransferase MiaA [Alphaproteobacteria bacterium]|nr:tRNA (adenosine(37)-N6)-dimethylallyltransferase MiaA [Alphaproteobacteria bacterium]
MRPGSSQTAVILIAGPTASGKSALALDLAIALDGVIINADALQVYADLRILSARPDDTAMAQAPHRLYGCLDAAITGSAGWWRDAALAEIDAAHEAGRLPIVVGGTGLYLRALQHGLADIPPVPALVRQQVTALYEELGGAAFRERLVVLDPAAAARLPVGDRQRLIRAWEIVQATGLTQAEWQQRSSTPTTVISPLRFATILLAPPRAALYATCDARFRSMITAGGLDEAAALMARGLDPALPAMKGVGVPEILAHLRGERDLEGAIAAAQQATRRYAKRQTTWFRHQIQPGLTLVEQYSESLLRCSRHFIEGFLLTKTG